MNWDATARQQWEQHGVLRDRLTEEEWLADGRWIIGSRAPEGHPGQVVGWCYKSWVARAERYAPGSYEWKHRTAKNEWEFVAVYVGDFIVEVRHGDTPSLIHLSHGGSVDLTPQPERRWELASQEKPAWGWALLRPLPAGVAPVTVGAGEQYEYHAGTISDLPLASPHQRTDWRVRFVEVFGGYLRYTVTVSGRPQVFEMGPKEHIFLSRQAVGSFHPIYPADGVVIYY